MATIKEVAKAAGVSYGTVSNVLKGLRSVSLENVMKVERAIMELGYRPDAAARRLKANSSQSVGVLLPNITNSMFAQIYSSAEATLSEHGYNTELFITHDLPEKEIIALECAQGMRLSGVLLVTCQPGNNKLFEEVMASGMKLAFIEREPDFEANTISLRSDESVYYAVKALADKGSRHFALITGPKSYSSERLCETGFRRALDELDLEFLTGCVRRTSLASEDGFRAAAQLLSGDSPDAIICTSTQTLDGVLEAIKYACNGQKPHIAVLGESWWSDNRYPEVTLLPRACMELGEKAALLLLENLRNAAFFDMKRLLVNGTKPEAKFDIARTTHFEGTTIHAAMIEGDMSSAVRSLLPDLMRKYGIAVELNIFPHERLYDFITRELRDSRYDVFSVDILWLKEFASNGLLYDLTPIADDAFMENIDTHPALLDDFARYNGRIFAIPHMYCNQLLFYRKDLFESYSCRRHFYEQHKVELRPPQTWSEFNAVARFFTRQYNPNSETEFGTTLGGRYSSAALCEYLARCYAYGAEVFDKRGRVTLCSDAAIKALDNYAESFKYASAGSPDHWWHEQVAEFAQGKAAMMVMYSSYAAPLVDRNTSCVVGKTGFSAIPGGRPVLGGWSFGINNNSQKKDAAAAFIQWVSAKELSIPLTLLGNFSASKTVFESSDIKAIYPWIQKSLDEYPRSVRRSLPKDKAKLSIKRYEEIISEHVHSCIIGELSARDTLAIASAELSKMLDNKDSAFDNK